MGYENASWQRWTYARRTRLVRRERSGVDRKLFFRKRGRIGRFML